MWAQHTSAKKDETIQRPNNGKKGPTMMQKSDMTPFGMWGFAAVSLSAALAVTVLQAGAATLPPDHQPQMQQDLDMQKIMGTVKKTKKVETQGGDQEHLVVQLKLQEAESMIVADLGDVEKLKDMDIQVGNRITAWGRSVNVGDKSVFMVHRLQTNDGMIDIERQSSGRQPSADGYDAIK
jgi:hypothetical protein